MIHHLIGKIAEFVIFVISASGYPGIIALMAIESACIPLPSEIIMPFAGYLVSIHRMSLLAAATSGAIGNLLGSIAIYWLGKNQGSKLIERLSPHHVQAANSFYARYGVSSVFFGRMLPVIRTFISLPAGIMRIPLIPFCLWTLIGSFPWCLGLTFLGKKLGENWNSLEPVFHRIDIPVVIILVAGIAYWSWRNK